MRDLSEKIRQTRLEWRLMPVSIILRPMPQLWCSAAVISVVGTRGGWVEGPRDLFVVSCGSIIILRLKSLKIPKHRPYPELIKWEHPGQNSRLHLLTAPILPGNSKVWPWETASQWPYWDSALCSIPSYKIYIHRKKCHISYRPKYCRVSNIHGDLQRRLRGTFI